MLFRKYHDYSERGVTPRRLAAAARALKKERAALPLFSKAVATQQPTPLQRLEAFIQSNKSIYHVGRDREARTWRWARRRLFSLNSGDRWRVMVRWNSMVRNHQPGGAAYFADFLAHWIRVRYPNYWFSDEQRTAKQWTAVIENSPTYLTKVLHEREITNAQHPLF